MTNCTISGLSKTFSITGWRLGFAHGPKPFIEEMAKLQQFTFVCAPSIVQQAGVTALHTDISAIVADYKAKRDRMCAELGEYYEIARPGGAFYVFPKVPRGTGEEFVREAIRHNMLVIPGGVFSGRDTHFRISYAATDETLHRGIEVLNRMAG